MIDRAVGEIRAISGKTGPKTPGRDTFERWKIEPEAVLLMAKHTAADVPPESVEELEHLVTTAAETLHQAPSSPEFLVENLWPKGVNIGIAAVGKGGRRLVINE